MELQEVLQKRRSVRQFSDEKVSDSDIECLMHGAMSGPSACNVQPWDFYVVSNEDVLNKLHYASKYTNIKAPLAIVVCGNLDRALPNDLASYWIQDCSAATENILLTACDLGLGSVWCGIHPQDDNKERVKEALGLKDNLIPLNIIYIGHPTVEVTPRDQYKEEFIHFVK